MIVRLEASLVQYQREMQRAVGVSDRTARSIENRFRNMNRNLDNLGRGLTRSLTGPLAGLAAAVSVREVLQYADAWTRAGNRVRASGVPLEDTAATLEEIYAIAQRSRTAIESVAGAYSRISISAGQLGLRQRDVLKLTETVAKALQVGGASAGEAAATVTQLTQALGSGVLQGDELRSIRENSIVLAQAIADEFQTTVGGLKVLGEQGKLTADRVARAILNANAQVEKSYASLNITIEGAFTNVSNAFTRYIGQTNEGLGASQRLVQALTALAENFDTVADVALRFASIIAGALVGRGIVGLVRGAANGARAISTLVTAARAGVGVFSALGGALGPLGLLIGGIATAVWAFSGRSAEATKRTEALYDEMRRLGLIADDAAEGVDRTSEAVDRLSNPQRRQKLADIADELERLRGGSGLLNQLFVGDLNGLADIITQIDNMRATPGGLVFESDIFAAEEIRDIAAQLQAGAKFSDEMKDRLETIGNLRLSDEVNAWVLALGDIAEKMGGLEALAEKTRTPFDDLSDKLAEIVRSTDELGHYAAGIANAQTLSDIKAFADELGKTPEFADDLIATLDGLEGLDLTAPVRALIAKLREAAVLAQSVLNFPAIDQAVPRRGSLRGITGNADNPEDAGMAGVLAGQAYLAEEARRRALTQAERDLEDEVKRLREALEKENPGAFVSDAQVEALARANLGARGIDLTSFLAAGKNVAAVGRLQGDFAEALAAMLAAAPESVRSAVTINSGFRTFEEQARLFAEAVRKYGSEEAARRWVAPPGSSQHNMGNAADLGFGNAAAGEWVRANAARFGLTFPMSWEPWHIESAGARGQQQDDEFRQRYEDAQKLSEGIDGIFASMQQETAGIEAEAAAVGKSTYEREKMRAVMELENRLREAGVNDIEAYRAQIDALAESYAQASVNAENAANSAAALADAAAEAGDLLGDAMKSFVKDLIAGKSAAEALSNVLGNIANKLIDKGIDLLINAIFGGLGGGGGGLFAGLFGGGRLAGALPTVASPRLTTPVIPAAATTRAAAATQAAPARVLVQVAPGQYFDARVARISGPVSAETTRRGLTEVQDRNRRFG